MGEQVPVREAAARLGVSTDTVRRRMRSGGLAATKRPTPQGFVWLVELPDDAPPGVRPPVVGDDTEVARLRAQVDGLRELAGELRRERDDWREQAVKSDDAARELRVLVRQAQELARALPAGDGYPGGAPPGRAAAPGPARPRWKFWVG